MADLTPHTDSQDPTGGTGTPRWVKVFGIIAIVLAVLFVILLIAGGDHGPARHTSSLDARHTPPSASTA